MSSRLRSAVIALSMVSSLAASVAAAGADVPELRARYGLDWAGIQVAMIDLDHRDGAERYLATVFIRTAGLVDKLAKFRASVRTSGQHAAEGGRLVPQRFGFESRSRKKTREAAIQFDPRTGDVTALELTKRGAPERSKVPPELQRGVIDPITAFLRLRRYAAEARRTRALQPFEVAVFDGRRRYDVVAEARGRGRAKIAGRKWAVLRLDIKVNLLAGANRDDTNDVEAGDDRMHLELLVSDDEQTLPLELRTLDSLLTTRLTLIEHCAAATSRCRPPSG